MKRVVLAVLAAMLVLASPAAAAEPSLSWSAPQTVAPDTIGDVDCPTAGLCVAVDAGGNVITTTNPTGPAAGWASADVFGASLDAVSCSSASFCIAAGQEGNLLASTNPTGGAAAWTATKVPGVGDLEAVDCTVGACAALDSESRILLSGNPTGGPGAWAVAEFTSGSISLTAIDCPDSGLCVAVGHGRRNMGGGLFVQENLVVTIADPGGAGRSFKNSFIGFRSFIEAISCPTATFCLAVDRDGYAWSSTAPAGGEAAWQEVFVDSSGNLADVSCPTSSFCVALDESSRALTSTNPAGEATDWGVAPVPSGILGLSCPSTSLCLAGGERQVTAGTPPVPVTPDGSQPPPAWTPPPLPRGTLGFGRVSRLSVKNWKVKVLLSCSSMHSCSGGIKLTVPNPPPKSGGGRPSRPRQLRIGAAAFSILPGTTEKVMIPLNKRGRELLRATPKLPAFATVDGRATGAVIKMRKRFLLQAP